MSSQFVQLPKVTSGGGGSSQWTTLGSNIYYNLGNVGIGTTNPSAPLHVYDSVGVENTIKFSSSNSGIGAIIGLDASPGGGHFYRIMSGGSANGQGASSFILYDQTAAAKRLIVTPDGKVGINVSLPSQALSVGGVIESTSGGFKFPDGTMQTTAAAGAQIGGKIAAPGTQSGFSGGWKVVEFSTANSEFDTGSVVGTNELVAPQAGIYTCTAFAYSPTNSSSEFITLAYSINAGGLQAFVPTSYGNAGSYAGTGGSFQVKLNAGDKVKLSAYAPQGQIAGVIFSMVKG